jgi:hypothetical protein
MFSGNPPPLEGNIGDSFCAEDRENLPRYARVSN